MPTAKGQAACQSSSTCWLCYTKVYHGSSISYASNCTHNTCTSISTSMRPHHKTPTYGPRFTPFTRCLKRSWVAPKQAKQFLLDGLSWAARTTRLGNKWSSCRVVSHVKLTHQTPPPVTGKAKVHQIALGQRSETKKITRHGFRDVDQAKTAKPGGREE